MENSVKNSHFNKAPKRLDFIKYGFFEALKTFSSLIVVFSLSKKYNIIKTHINYPRVTLTSNI